MTDRGAGADGWHASDASRDHPCISSMQSGMTCTGHESRQDSNADVGEAVVGHPVVAQHPSNASECDAWETSKVWEECGMDASASKAQGASAATPTWSKGKIKVPGTLRSLVGDAVREFEMIGEGDKVLVGVSGGKDSLTMLHVLLELQRRSPLKFDIAAATVDPQTPEYDPSALVSYMEHLGVRYHLLSKPIIEMAKTCMDAKRPSLCSFCSRMKRGMLYSCMREHGYTCLALGQHLDDGNPHASVFASVPFTACTQTLNI